MKRHRISILLLCLALALCACTVQNDTYTAERDGKTFLVDTVNHTITEGDNRYHYDFTGDRARYSITITYPNGSSYWWSHSGGAGGGGWSPDYVENAYADGETLCQLILLGAPTGSTSGKPVGALVLMVLGGLDLAFPKVAWYLSYGWRFKNAEPSQAALIIARVSGVAALLLGLFLLR